MAAIERELPGDCKTAESHLDKAIDCIMDYIDRFERGLEKQGLEPDRHSPELKTQYRCV